MNIVKKIEFGPCEESALDIVIKMAKSLKEKCNENCEFCPFFNFCDLDSPQDIIDLITDNIV